MQVKYLLRIGNVMKKKNVPIKVISVYKETF